MADPVEAPLQDRIEDARFREAVACVDAGDAEGLARVLEGTPGLTRQRVAFEGHSYFATPALLDFVAENPIRNASLPGNIVEIARLILSADPGPEAEGVQETLGLVSSGRIVRECGVQVPLIRLLCEFGADPNGAMSTALGHGEFDAVDALLSEGASRDLIVAAATGDLAMAGDLVDVTLPRDRHRALALAAQHGHAPVVELLLNAGESPDRYNPEGAHAHSTPLHQAALANHVAVVEVLLAHDARRAIPDRIHNATPWGWAMHAGHTQLAAHLKPDS